MKSAVGDEDLAGDVGGALQAEDGVDDVAGQPPGAAAAPWRI